jgi:integrase
LAARLDAQTFDEATRETTGTRLNSMIFPFLGAKNIGEIRPTDVRGWTRWMHRRRLRPAIRQSASHVSAIFRAAVEDKILTENPCQARSVTRPKPDERKVVPWTRSRVKKIRMAMPEQHKIMVPIGAGLGLRQGEIFGLGADQIDRDEMVIHVVRQVKLISCFGCSMITFNGSHCQRHPSLGRTWRGTGDS